MFKSFLRNEKGFSLIEIMAVMIIIAVLIGGGMKFYSGYIENARVAKAKAQIATMQAAIDSYYAEKGVYPNGNYDQLDAALLVVGIRGEAKQGGKESKLVEKDPWGKEYMYKCSDDNKKAVIHTGYGDVQKPSTLNTSYVAGKSANGESSSPALEINAPATGPNP